jgi:hypothetical protein
LRVLDGRFQKLEVRHSVQDMPREKFNRQGSSITGMRADQLLKQIRRLRREMDF